MSNERPGPDNDDVSDSIVSQAYRETAQERVPAELDRAVLRRAAAAARPRYARSIVWLRPLAWTATIGLCLAIVLEITRVPLPEPAVFEVPAARGAPEEKTSPAGIDEAMPAMPMMDRSGLRKRNDDNAVDTETAETSALPSTESFAIQNPQLLQQAEDLARVHGDNIVKVEQLELRSLAIKAAAEISIPTECDGDATELPSVWLECIEKLEQAGLVDAAQRERERFQRAFPDDELP